MNPWDERFAGDGFAYGTRASGWLVENAHRIRRDLPVLCLGEGEGRNAVHLAGLGLDVEAVDGSAVGLAKGARLAASRPPESFLPFLAPMGVASFTEETP